MTLTRFLTTSTLQHLTLHHTPIHRELHLRLTTHLVHRHYTKPPEVTKSTGVDTKGESLLRVPELPKGLIGAGLRAKEGNKKADDWNDILNRWYQQYQDFVGITDLKKAQDRVTELSEGLLAAQGERRRLQREIEDLQARLVQNHQHITKTEQYSQEHMRLFSQARELNDHLRDVRGQFSGFEQTERDTFTQLSAAIRDCHERERMQAEQGKYWSIIASVVSAALASVITSVNNWVRIREIKDHVTTSQQSLQQGYQQMHQDILTSLASHTPQGTLKPSQRSQEGVQVTEEVVSVGGVVSQGVMSSKSAQEGVNMPGEVERGVTGVDGGLGCLAQRMSETVDGLTKDAVRVSQAAEKLGNLSLEFVTARENAEEVNAISKQAVENLTAASEGLVSQISAVLGARGGVPLPAEVGGGGGGDVSYPRVAATMMVGAALGTLVTAFFLGALGGSGG